MGFKKEFKDGFLVAADCLSGYKKSIGIEAGRREYNNSFEIDYSGFGYLCGKVAGTATFFLSLPFALDLYQKQKFKNSI